MLGVLVNTAAVLLGSTVGLLCKKGIPEKYTNAVLTAIGLCTVSMGIKGSLTGTNALILIFSMILGVVTGTLLNLDGGITVLSEKLSKRTSGEGSTFTQGFVTACLMFCVGSMTFMGSLDAGLTGNCETLYTKSLLDLISSVLLSASLGIGVLFSAVFVLVFQGGLVLLAGVLQPVLTEFVIGEIVCVGSVILIGLGLNIMKITNIKTADYLPAMLFAPLVCAVFTWLS